MGIFRWFNYNQWFYWIAGALLVVLSVFAIFDANDDNREKTEALAAAPPPATPLAAFDENRHSNPVGEVRLIALPVIDRIYHWERTALGVDIPYSAILLKAEASDDVIRAVVIENSSADDDLRAWVATEGLGTETAPVHGVILSGDRDDDRAALNDALRSSGLTLSEDALMIEPFFAGREAGLTPDHPLEFASVLAGFGLLLIGYGFVRRWMKRRRLEIG